MLVKFETLFTVYIEHNYFTGSFNGFKFTLAADSYQLMKRYGLIHKTMPGGFMIFFENVFAGKERSRQKMLEENLILRFRIELTDHLFYNYTGSMPAELGDTIFWFSNLDEKTPVKNRQTLHQHDFAGESEARQLTALKKIQESLLIKAGETDAKNMITFAWPGGPAFNELYFSKPFGFIEVQLHDALDEKMYIRFATISTFWRYVFLSDHLQHWANAAIVDNSSGKKLQGPDILTLPDGRSVRSFITEAPVALTQQRNLSFQLIENYDPVNNQISKDQNVLPNPDITVISKIDFSGNNVIKKNISNILL